MRAEEEEELAELAIGMSNEDPNFLSIDPIFSHHTIAKFPTGTIIVSSGNTFELSYHNNDLNQHLVVLVWVAYDGSDRVTLYYEPGVSRPMILDLIPYNKPYTCNTILIGIGEAVRRHDMAYIPRSNKLLSHRRYLETVFKLIKTLPLVHLSNSCHYGFQHKYLPLIRVKPEDVGFADARQYYWDLVRSANPIMMASRELRHVCMTCADVVMLFVSLLHEELFIKITTEEFSQGIIPETEKILHHGADRLDAGGILSPNSQLFRLYEREPHPTSEVVFTVDELFITNGTLFLLPYIIMGMIFLLFGYFILGFSKPSYKIVQELKSGISETFFRK